MPAKWSWGASGVLVSETWLTTGLPQLDGHRYDGGDAVLARIALFPHVGQQRWLLESKPLKHRIALSDDEY